jgi:hypothetical protein
MSIFISYRRGATTDITGRIHDWLEREFDTGSVIRDVDSIPPGVNFWYHLKRELARCEAVVAVIGPDWDLPGLQQPTDFVRQELEFALKHGIPIVPVLVGEADMPTADALPATMREFTDVQALRVDSGREFKRHVAELTHALKAARERYAAERSGRPPPHESRLRLFVGVGALLFVLLGGAIGMAWKASSDAAARQRENALALAKLSAELDALRKQYREEGERAQKLEAELKRAKDEAERKQSEAARAKDEATKKRLEGEVQAEIAKRVRLEAELSQAKATREQLSKSASGVRKSGGGALGAKACQCVPGDPLCDCL